MKNFSCTKSKILFIITFFVMTFQLFCAPKNKKKNNEQTTNILENNQSLDVGSKDYEQKEIGTSIKLPSAKRTFFNKIEKSIIEQVEDGNPESLRNAVYELRRNVSKIEENEKVLVNIATQIMKIVYPSEKINWELFDVENTNPYLGALSSVEQGVFDMSTGNTDFLSIILPALLVTKKNITYADCVLCENAINSALSINKNSTLANYLMALLKTKQEKYKEAEVYFEKAYLKNQTNQEITISYVNNLRINGKIIQASEILNNSKSISSELAILKQNAYIAFDSNDLTSAELYVVKVLQQTPNDLEFLLFRAKILIEKKDYIHAVSLLDMYARQENSSIDYLILRAKVQLDWSKNTIAATETVEKALQLYPENKDALMFAARISSQIDAPVAGKYADELAGLVLRKDPNSQEAMLYALDGLAQRENWAEAYQICKKVMSYEVVSPQTVEKYVSICIAMKKMSEAYEVAKKYYEKLPENEILLQAYVTAYCEVGGRETVLKYINSLLTSASPKIKSYLYFRRSYLQLTEETVLADLRSSLISNPRNSEALFRLYEIYFSKEDYRKAQYYLRQVVAINPNDNSMKKLNEALTKLIK